MLTTEFTPIDPAGRDMYLDLFARTPERAADYTFTNLWAWAVEFGLEWAVRDSLCWIRQMKRVERPTLWAPVGDWDGAEFAARAEFGPGVELVRVPESLCERLRGILGERLVVEDTPGQWEYVYETKSLIELSGNVLHKKRNHLNWFQKNYGEDFRELTVELLPQAQELERLWLEAQGEASSKALRAENRAAFRVLCQWDELSGLKGGALFAEGRMVAFCIGEALDEKTLVVHFEKALPGIRGAYQAINWHFARTVGAGQGFDFINREQDGDDPGLRQAKRGYAPVRQLRKNTVRVLG